MVHSSQHFMLIMEMLISLFSFGATPTRGFAEHDATVIGLPAHLT